MVWLPTGEQGAAPYRAVNPQGLVPTLVDDELRLSQSLAIMKGLRFARSIRVGAATWESG